MRLLQNTTSRNIFFISFILGICVCVLASAQETPATLSLSQALRLALTRHADMIIADERVKQALARIEEDASALLPQLRGSVSETRQTRDVRSTGINFPGDPLTGPFNVYDARLRLTQQIFDPAAIARLKASRQGRVVSLAEEKKVREDVLMLVSTLFIEAKRAKDHLAAQQLAFRNDKKTMSVIFSRLKSGLSSTMDMKKARAKYARALYDYAVAQKKAVESRLDLWAALDLPQERNIELVWDNRVFDKKTPQGVLSENQPDIRLAYEQLKFDEQKRAASRWDFWPKVSVMGEYGPNGLSPNSRDSSETYALGVSASIPIFEGGLRQANLKQSESAVRVSQTQFQSLSRGVKANLFSQYAMVDAAKSLVEENDKNVAVALEEWRLVGSQFRVGDASSLDLSSAEVNWRFAEDQKQEALAFELLAKIRLARVLGDVEQFLLQEK